MDIDELREHELTVEQQKRDNITCCVILVLSLITSIIFLLK